MSLLIGRCYFCDKKGILSAKIFWPTFFGQKQWKKACARCEVDYHRGELKSPKNVKKQRSTIRRR